jgi:8-oxo-dGTP diphosphatase
MIDKVGAIVIRDKKMLIVREADIDIFFIPGGSREANENDEEALRREMLEETGVQITNTRFYRKFTAKASRGDGMVTVKAYFCDVDEEPRPAAEIGEIRWIGRDDYKDVNLGNILKIMIPVLIGDGYL